MTKLFDTVGSLESPSNMSLILAIVWVINNNYAKFTTTSLTLAQYAITPESQRQHHDIMTGILVRASNYVNSTADGCKIKFIIEGKNAFSESKIDRIFKNLTDEELFYRTNGNRDKAIWFVDSMEAYEHMEVDLLDNTNHFYRDGFYCIIYTDTGSDRLVNIRTIFRRLFVFYVTNVNVFIMIGSTPYVYTYFPFDIDRCQSSTPKLYFNFRNILKKRENFALETEFFPTKVSNLYGCELVVAIWQNPPYVFMDNAKETNGNPRISGIEGNILALLAKRMNFNVKIVNPERGIVYQNGTGTGSLKMLHDGEINMTIGTFMYEKARADYLLASVSYMSTPLVIVIPKGRTMSPWERLTKPFKYIIWSCFCTSVLLGILVIFSFKLLGNTNITRFIFGARNQAPFTNLWNSLYGGSISVGMPTRNFSRYLLAIWLLYTLILRNAYIGELYLILQDGRSHANMQSILEVASQNYTFFTAPTLEPILRGYISDAKIDYIDNERNNKDYLLEQIRIGSSKIVIMVFGPTVSFFNKQQMETKRRVNVLPEHLLTVPITLYMRQHSYLKHYLNDMLMSIMSSGLISKELSFYLDGNLDSARVDHKPIALTIWLLFGIFSVYMCLLTFCLLIFLFELWSRRSPLTRCVLDFFNC